MNDNNQNPYQSPSGPLPGNYDPPKPIGITPPIINSQNTPSSIPINLSLVPNQGVTSPQPAVNPITSRPDANTGTSPINIQNSLSNPAFSSPASMPTATGEGNSSISPSLNNPGTTQIAQNQPNNAVPDTSSIYPNPRITSGGVFSYQATPIPEPKKSKNKKKLIILICLSILTIILGGLAIFYFAYWTKQEVVYSRAQKQMASVLSSTINSEIKLFNDTEIDFELSTESKDFPLSGKLNSRLLESGSETDADVTFDKASINIGFMTTNNEDKTTGYYIRYKGIEQFYKSLISSFNSKAEEDRGNTTLNYDTYDPFVNVLKKYENKWVFINIFGLLSGDEEANTETINQDDVKTVTEKFIPIINNRFVGLDKNNAVIKTSNIRSDKVAGVSAWAYDLEMDDSKYNSMIDELIKAIDQTNLSEQKKKILKESLESEKIKTKNDDYKFDYGYSSESIQKYTIWLEKTSAAPVKYTIKDTQLYNKKLTYSNETIVSLESISPSKITGSYKTENISYGYDDGKESYRSVGDAKFTIDNKSTNTAVTGTFDPNNTEENDLYTFKIGVKTNTNKTKIQAPVDAINYKTIYDELTKIESSNL